MIKLFAQRGTHRVTRVGRGMGYFGCTDCTSTTYTPIDQVDRARLLHAALHGADSYLLFDEDEVPAEEAAIARAREAVR